MIDVLSDIFDTVRLRATLYFRTDFSAPFAITVPSYGKAARFHLVVQGRCTFTLASGRVIELSAGDLIVIPQGAAHMLSDQEGRSPAPLETVIQQSGYDGRGVFVLGEGDPLASTQLVCGHFGFSQGADHPLLRAMPECIVMTPADRARHGMLDEVLRLVVRRAFEDGLGGAAAIARLSEVFFIEVIRAARDKYPELEKVIGALADPQIGRAIELIHRNSAKPWTVETLASEVGMSRSRFAERFTELVGEAPMSYLTEWRLQQALLYLAQPHASIQDVARRVGYQSAAAFTRAFTAKLGAAPSEFKRR